MCADRLDQSIIATTPAAAATGRVMQFNEWYCRVGELNSSKSVTSVRNVIKAAGIECGKRDRDIRSRENDYRHSYMYTTHRAL
jgi:hypothetical protein